METTDYIPEHHKQNALRPGEIVIEIDNEHLNSETTVQMDPYEPFNPNKMKRVTKTQINGNRHHQFPPVETRTNYGVTLNFIRTRQILDRHGLDTRYSFDPALRGIEYIMGERIHIDFDGKIGRITDAIFDPENMDHYNRLVEAGYKIRGAHCPLVPGAYFEQKLNDPYALWGWAYHMRKIMDGDGEHGNGPERHRGCCTIGPRWCRPVQNVEQMPTMLEILQSKYVRLSLPPMTREQCDQFDKDREASDPNYVPIDRRTGTVIASPWMFGMDI